MTERRKSRQMPLPLEPWTQEQRRITRQEFEELKAEVKVNTELTKANAELTRGIAADMKRNTEITETVHGILQSFKLVATAAKWVTVVGAAVAMLWKGVVALLGAHVVTPHS